MNEEEARLAFQKIKREINSIDLGLSSLKEALSIQNSVLITLLDKINILEQNSKKNDKLEGSTGNDGVNQ